LFTDIPFAFSAITWQITNDVKRHRYKT